MAPDRIPGFFVIDEKNNVFWEDATVSLKGSEAVSTFLKQVEEGKVDGKGPGAGMVGHLSAVVRNLFRELTNSYALMAMVGFFVLMIGVVFYMVCTGAGDDEEVQQAAAEQEESAQDKKKN